MNHYLVTQPKTNFSATHIQKYNQSKNIYQLTEENNRINDSDNTTYKVNNVTQSNKKKKEVQRYKRMI